MIKKVLFFAMLLVAFLMGCDEDGVPQTEIGGVVQDLYTDARVSDATVEFQLCSLETEGNVSTIVCEKIERAVTDSDGNFWFSLPKNLLEGYEAAENFRYFRVFAHVNDRIRRICPSGEGIAIIKNARKMDDVRVELPVGAAVSLRLEDDPNVNYNLVLAQTHVDFYFDYPSVCSSVIQMLPTDGTVEAMILKDRLVTVFYKIHSFGTVRLVSDAIYLNPEGNQPLEIVVKY